MKIFIFLCLFVCIKAVTAQGQPDSVPWLGQLGKQYQETAYKLLLGINLQGSTQVNPEKSLKYLKIGLHRTVTDFGGRHMPIAWTCGLSTEILLDKSPIYGFKMSTWATAFFFVAGMSTVYYTDFKQGNFKIRPEIGFGAYPFKLTMGYNIPTIFNKDFERVRRNNMQITLNILLRLKTIKRK